MLGTAINNMCFLRTAAQRIYAATNLRNHAAVNAALEHKLMSLFKGQRRNEATFIRISRINAAHISQHQQLFCLQRTGNITGNNIGVNVIGFAIRTNAGRSDDGDIAAVQQAVDKVGVDMLHAADKADIYQINLAVFINIGQIFFSLQQLGILAVEADSLAAQAVQTANKVGIDFANKRHLCDSSGFSVSNAQTADKLALLAGLLQLTADFRTAAMNDYRTHTGILQEQNILQHLVLQLVIKHSITAILYDNGLIFKITEIRQCFD